MTVKEWCNEHNDVSVSITHPNTLEGWKVNIEMTDPKTGSHNVFRESIRYAKPTDKDICELLSSMYVDFLNKRAANI